MNNGHIVWLDAGHGGADSGALSPLGLKESDVALAISLYAGKVLEEHGVIVQHSRITDRSLTLTERSSLANKAKAALFVSVHLNSAKNPASGIETFALNEDSKGKPLAERVQDEMLDAFPDANDRGVKVARFSVLRKTQMPACLVEVGFIHTNAGHERFSKQSTIESAGRAIAYGILKQLGVAILDEALTTEEAENTEVLPSTVTTALATDELHVKLDWLRRENARLEKENTALTEILTSARKALG